MNADVEPGGIPLGPWHVVALSLATLVFIAATVFALPPQVATRFAAGGPPSAWMTRDGYTLFMLVFAVVLPWVAFAGIALVPKRWPGAAKLADDAPAQRENALRLLRRFGIGLAAAMTVLGGAMHGAILAAHRRTPPQLDEGPFLFVVGLFVAGLVVAALRFHRKWHAR